MIRSSRLKRYKNRRKKQKKLPILLQVAMINYSLLVTGAYLISPTNASFNDIEMINASLHVGWEWEDHDDDDGTWDKSSLEAIDQGLDDEGRIYTIITNTGDKDMRGPVIYELYWTEKGNPKPEHGGIMLAQGEIPALMSNGEYTIYFTPIDSGNYMFKIFQRPGHPGQGELWSEAIAVNLDKKLQLELVVLTPQLTEEDQIALEEGRLSPGGGSGALPIEKELELIPQEPIRNDEEEIGETLPSEDVEPETPDRDTEEESSKEETTIETPEEEEEPLEETPGLEEESQDEEEASSIAEEQDEESESDESIEENDSEAMSDNTEESDTETDSKDTEESDTETDSDDTEDSSTESSEEESAYMIQTLVRALS